MEPVIELEGLGVRFGSIPILQDLAARLTGRAIGLLGPNGAGKTTLIHTLLGFHPPATGTAKVFGHDIRNGIRDIRAIVGYMPEQESFIAGMSAVRFLCLMGEVSGLPPRVALERSHEALFYVGLGEARYRPMETYSLGMKQLAKLAQAVVHGPRVLFLDEPTNGLDPPHRARMLRLIREIRDVGDVRLFVSSHLLHDVEEVCDEVLVLKNGRVATYCNLEEERKANRKFLILETAGDNGSFGREVEQLGVEYAQPAPNRWRMVLPAGVEIRDLFRIASARGIRIRRLDYKRDSLQDIFLKAMEEDRGGL